MSDALAERLGALLAAGHARPPPTLRGDADFAPDQRTLRPAAVLIAVTHRPGHPDGPGVILTHRPATMRAHPGQAAFPGGKLDAGETPRQAALREAFEELAMPPEAVTVVGETDRYQTGSGYDITPVLAVVPGGLQLVPNPAEVAEWFEPPLAFLLDAANRTEHRAQYMGRERRYLDIQWGRHRIWGVTAGIIANLAARLDWPGA